LLAADVDDSGEEEDGEEEEEGAEGEVEYEDEDEFDDEQDQYNVEYVEVRKEHAHCFFSRSDICSLFDVLRTSSPVMTREMTSRRPRLTLPPYRPRAAAAALRSAREEWLERMVGNRSRSTSWEARRGVPEWRSSTSTRRRAKPPPGRPRGLGRVATNTQQEKGNRIKGCWRYGCLKIAAGC
jgi:hypothetical protein